MGFGAYDEDDQEEQDVDYDEEDGVSIDRDEDNEMEFDYGGKSTEELLQQANTPTDSTDEAEE